MISMAHYSVSD
uniref:Uncharacterized protein n=1 Tax=Rhizophora mucronata TaxID=61149 RepID=A0A2P2NBL2_RHIMU